MVPAMLPFIRRGRRLRSAEVADTTTSLGERFGPYLLTFLGWAFPSVGGTLLGWWSAAQVAAPFAVGFGIVVAVAIRIWWINEGPKLSLAEQPAALAPPEPALHGALSDAAVPPQPDVRELAASVDELRRAVERIESGGSTEVIVQSLQSIVERNNEIERRIAALQTGLADAETRGERRVAEAGDFLLAKLTKLDEDFEFFRKRLDHFEKDARERFLLRDTDAALRELAGPIAALSERVVRADPTAYPNAEAWRLEVGEWQAKVQNFWNLAGRWHALIADDPPLLARRFLEVSPADLSAVKEAPGTVVPGDFSAQQTWRFAAVVAARHRRHATRVMGMIHDRAMRGLHDRSSPT